ncbi:MAG: hypothetical protein Q9M09_00615 [Mariprofundaceae bacterium]|nr:hypothetical protein [Mariprofundaceae bacterium]
MNKIKIFTCTVLLALLLPFYAHAGASHAMRQTDQTTQQLAYLKLLLSQLRDAASSIKNIENLTMVGMPRNEVTAMRHAMELKVQDMQKEALLTIHNL